MGLFLSIRVAEPWTPLSVAVLVLLGIALIGAIVWLIHRYRESVPPAT
jgi:hypothetical protein